MRILRGILLAVGTAIVFLAACATEWEPVPILLMGGTGLALCGIAGGIKKAAGRAGTRRGGRGIRGCTSCTPSLYKRKWGLSNGLYRDQ